MSHLQAARLLDTYLDEVLSAWVILESIKYRPREPYMPNITRTRLANSSSVPVVGGKASLTATIDAGDHQVTNHSITITHLKLR